MLRGRHAAAPDVFPALAACSTAVVWLAFGTTGGYFWLNRHRLEAIVAELDAVPGLVSLSIGADDRGRDANGIWRTFDSYRFVNGTVVTHYREQVAPDASQPVLYVDDVLRTGAVYWRLRHTLQHLSLAGLSRGPEGQVSIMKQRQGGTPWMTGFVFSPSGRMPAPAGVETHRRLTPRWFYVWAAL